MNMTDIKWLEDLKAKIVDQKDSDNFDDIIKCYQTGLLRAGFLMAWLMLIESLKRKVSELEAKDVKAAKTEMGKIKLVEDAMQSNDEAIRKAALACDLINKEEAQVLELLWKKRCIMSHPYMPEVKESDFRYIVENLVDLSLGRELMWSQTMINEYFEDLKNSTFVIPDTLEEKKEEADKILKMIPEKNYAFFWKTVFFEFSIALESSSRKHISMLRVLAMRFILLDGVDVNEKQYTLATQIKKYCPVCWGIFYIRKTWDKLNENYQNQLFRFLKDNKKESKKLLFMVYNLIKHHDNLKQEHIECYYAALRNYDVTDLEHYYVNKNLLLKRLYEEKIANNQFTDQGDFIDMLSSLDEEAISEYSAKQCQKIGVWVVMCCIAGTFKAQNFVCTKSEWTNNVDYVKGVAIKGLSDSKGKLYITKRHLEFVLPVLVRTSSANVETAMEEVAKLPVGNTCSEETICRALKSMVRQYLEEGGDKFKAMMRVVDKYCKD